jgi:glutathione S-transferase
MKLHYASASPFVRKVMVVIHEHGLLDQIEINEMMTTPMVENPPHVAQNPLGKIPYLEPADGPSLYDSRVICQYLDDLAGGGLYPPAPRHWEALTLEASGDGIMDAAVLMVYEGRCRPEDMVYPDWVEAQWRKVTRALDVLEARWMGHLAGPVDIGHIAVGAALEYLDFRHEDRSWRAGRPALANWQEGFAKRPSMAATQPA